MRVVYPRDQDSLTAAWEKRDYFIVAETSGVVRGYLMMRVDGSSAWITDVAVGRLWRRQRIGSTMFVEAYQHAKAHHVRRLTVETQTKNYPGICYCQNHGLTFCGFNDRYYPNYDIALFFGMNVR